MNKYLARIVMGVVMAAAMVVCHKLFGIEWTLAYIGMLIGILHERAA